MVSRRTICRRAFTDIPSRRLYWSSSVSGWAGEDFVARATLVSNVGLWIELRRCWAAWKGRAAVHLNGRRRGNDWHDLIYEWPWKIKRKGQFAASHFYLCFMAPLGVAAEGSCVETTRHEVSRIQVSVKSQREAQSFTRSSRCLWS